MHHKRSIIHMRRVFLLEIIDKYHRTILQGVLIGIYRITYYPLRGNAITTTLIIEY